MIRALRERHPEYLMEAFGLGAFMVSACVFGVALEHPASPLREALPSDLARRGLMGLAMGATAIAIVYSPWGKRSGAHINPAVTLAFLRLGKVRPVDAVFYVLAQTLGAIVGVALSYVALGRALSHPTTHFVVTAPGAGGVGVAFLAEVGISALLMTTVLVVSSSRWSRCTGLACGALVAAYITFEAPLSGMSMNPARTLGSAVVAGDFRALWVYLSAPPLGMLAAAEAFLRVRALKAAPRKAHQAV